MLRPRSRASGDRTDFTEHSLLAFLGRVFLFPLDCFFFLSPDTFVVSWHATVRHRRNKGWHVYGTCMYSASLQAYIILSIATNGKIFAVHDGLVHLLALFSASRVGDGIMEANLAKLSVKQYPGALVKFPLPRRTGYPGATACQPGLR